MRVGLLCQGFYPDAGGVESHTRDLARELLACGHEVVALALDYSGRNAPYAVHETEVEGVRLARMAYLYHDHRALADVVRNRRAEEVVRAWAVGARPDVVHVHHATGFGLGALEALRAAGLPVVMTLHDYWPLCPRGQMLRADGTFSDVPRPDACAACLAATWPHLLPSRGGEARGPSGERVADDLAAAEARTRHALELLSLPERLLTPSAAAKAVYVLAGVPDARIEVCENGIEVAGLVAEVARLRALAPPREGLALGVLGTVLPSKGALELAHAFLAAGVEEGTLEIHGALPSYHGDTRYVEALRALAAAEPGVRLHGGYALDELPAILARLDGVAAPSLWTEVYGLTVREARAAGLPVLVSDAGDLPAVTDGGRAGLVVPAGDRGAWIEAVRRFFGDAQQRARWAAWTRAPRSAREMTDQLLRVYGEVVGRRSG